MSPLLVILAAVFGAASATLLPRQAKRFAGDGGYARIVPLGGTVAVVLAVALGPVPVLPVYLLAAVPALLLAVIDLRCLRLPDPLVAALAMIAGVPLAVLRPEFLPTAVTAAVLVLVAYGLLALGGGLGLGDVKLAAVLALILGFGGWPAVGAGLVVAHLINGVIALVLLVVRRVPADRQLPFGPALLAGALLAITAV